MSFFKSITSLATVASQRSLLTSSVASFRGFATKSIFVGNLPFGLDREGLRSHFETQVNVVNVRLPLDHLGRSRGFGFVEVEEEDFDKVLEHFSNSELNGRQIRVDSANNDSRPPRN